MITATEMQSYKEKVLALMGRFSGEVRQLEVESGQASSDAGADLTEDTAHSGDLGKVTTEEEVGFVLLEHEQDLLAECAAALDRIEAGTFGVCESCRRPIKKSRMKVLPYTRYCLECANRERGVG